MAPFELPQSGTVAYALVFLVIGMGFGAALEVSGFGDTRKLAAQFYLTEMTVLKVMFTGIVVAAVLIFASSAFGLLDLSRVYVNETYLWPGIVGGLIMGVGFVIGGFCPGTSVVAASTLKLDGIFFLVGAGVGVWAFGETVGGFQPFFLSSSMGRFMVPELFGLSAGMTVVLLVAMALLMFWGAELSEAYFGRKEEWARMRKLPRDPRKLAAAGALLGLAALTALKGDPTPDATWHRMPLAVRQLVDDRAVFVHPAEVVALRQDLNLKVEVLDVRDERDFNLFHLGGSKRLTAAEASSPDLLRRLLAQPATTVTFLVGNGEKEALEAWKRLKAQGVGNLYVIEGGLNRWLELYRVAECVAQPAPGKPVGEDGMAWNFAYAVGERMPASWPELPVSHRFRSPCEPLHADGGAGHHGFTWPTYEYPKKVKLQRAVAVKGGCG